MVSRIRCHHPGEAVTVLRSDHRLRKVTRGACIERDPGAEERFCGGGAHDRLGVLYLRCRRSFGGTCFLGRRRRRLVILHYRSRSRSGGRLCGLGRQRHRRRSGDSRSSVRLATGLDWRNGGKCLGRLRLGIHGILLIFLQPAHRGVELAVPAGLVVDAL